mmetsp:Transcript_29802/g.45454  ORF Transcript_29802/g.45454 Transcript_29802/m.45454 type:complete len:114 (+) Transcript_29802:467-808(+)
MSNIRSAEQRPSLGINTRVEGEGEDPNREGSQIFDEKFRQEIQEMLLNSSPLKNGKMTSRKDWDISKEASPAEVVEEGPSTDGVKLVKRRHSRNSSALLSQLSSRHMLKSQKN